MREAFEDHDVVQCGMCFPGVVMSLTEFLDRRPAASREEMKEALVGNIRRCTGYARIINAALSLRPALEAVE
ncbi:2Fe-2S iron-sulfur cluster-binding protein [Rhizobium sp. Leaf341]|uniref:2Fe-2S iron-sulfur cluster-binding protein n=1 Tax=Rhizobium sp. Leaf341 TaxID=1736344 RepID=UPI000AFD2DEE|nr:2Fe-2S iron-sulfur cluster-binding protein [Rhizobium sp. Leaf341]